jgi:hypothetical protein
VHLGDCRGEQVREAEVRGRHLKDERRWETGASGASACVRPDGRMDVEVLRELADVGAGKWAVRARDGRVLGGQSRQRERLPA